MGQEKSLEAGEDLLTPTEITSQIPTNLEKADKYVIGAELTRGYMEKIWSTENLLGRDDRYLLLWHHRMNH